MYCNKEWKVQFNKIIEQIINELEADKDRYPIPKKDLYRDNGIERLRKLQKEISHLKEID